jgi:septation ring formation regulator EzrA
MSEQRLDVLEKQYHALLQRVERLDQTEKKHDFIIRDSSVKIGIAEGLAESTHRELAQLKVDLLEIRSEIKQLRNSTEQNFEDVHFKLDQQSELLRQVLAKLP